MADHYVEEVELAEECKHDKSCTCSSNHSVSGPTSSQASPQGPDFSDVLILIGQAQIASYLICKLQLTNLICNSPLFNLPTF